ncbi:MAG: hypothetical protein KF803_01460 [Cyclobacteriaceae bacterium]|nr:hypothetical protein [Cyclobacteriaceae bacterium]
MTRMLINDFFSVQEKHSDSNRIEAALILNPEHAIFTGHFPQKPVVPGVCMVQIVREMIEADRQIKLQLVLADSIKFLNVIDPNETTSINLSVQISVDEVFQYKVAATIFSGEVIYFKLSGIFSIVNG